MSIRLRYPELAPDGYAALSAFGHYVNTGTALAPVLIELVNLCASLLNGCDFCIQMHQAELRKHHEPESRIEAVAAWQSSDAFTPRERAALAWTDVITRLETGSHASDEDYAAVSAFFEGKNLADLTFAIANINAWNRLGVAFRPHWNAGHARQAAATQPAAEAGETVSAVDDDGGKVAQD